MEKFMKKNTKLESFTYGLMLPVFVVMLGPILMLYI